MSGGPDPRASTRLLWQAYRGLNRAGAFLVVLLLLGGALRAEPLYPLLRPTQADSLRRQLWHTPPSRKRIALLLSLSQDLISRYQSMEMPLDSAPFFSQQAAALSHQLADVQQQTESCYVAANLCVALGNVAEGKKRLLQGLASSSRHHYARLEADGWYYLNSTCPPTVAGFPQRIACLQQAMKRYQSLNDGARVAYTLKTIADVHMQQGQDGLAHAELLQVLARYRTVGYRQLHYTFDLLSLTSSSMGDYPAAFRYGHAAIASAVATRDTADLNLFYCRMGALYRLLNQFPNALSYYNNVLQRAERTHDVRGISDALILVTEVMIAQHQPGPALRLAQEKLRQYPMHDLLRIDSLNLLARGYLANQQLDLANTCNLQLIKVVEQNQQLEGRRGMLLRAYLRATQIHLLARQYSKARLYLNKATAEGNQNYASGAERLLLLSFKLDSAQGNYLAAIGHQQRYQLLRDSVFNDKRSKQLASLQGLFNTQKKEQEMTLLTKQNQVQRANIRRRELQRNASLAGAFLLAVVLGLGYNRYRLKQRSNHQLEAKQEEIFSQNRFLEEVLTEKNGLLEEKEWMLREIHHRVKNNLQIIGSLLRSQAVYLPDGAARTAVRESRNRVHSMALIHQKLYQSNRLTGVPMDAYIQEIVDHLRASFDCPATIRTELAVAAVELDVALAVPVGLILNEAITNALKYAFPGGRAGTLAIAFEVLPTRHYRLTVQDDGVGFAPDFDLTQSRTLGLSLIQGLSKQIDGHLQAEGHHGVHITLEFAPSAQMART